MRVSRATNGAYAMLIAMTGATSPLPNSATAMIAISSDGKAKTTSKMRPSAGVEPSAAPAGEQTQQHAEDRREDDHDEERAEEGGARAVDHAAQGVAAEPVGAEPVRGARAPRRWPRSRRASGSYGAMKGANTAASAKSAEHDGAHEEDQVARGCARGVCRTRTARVGEVIGHPLLPRCADRSRVRARR